MDWYLKLMQSSVGRKMVIAFTGLFLCSFLLVHLYINIHLLPIPGFSADNGATFGKLAEFMADTLIIRILEVGLFLGFLMHAGIAIRQNIMNKMAKPVGYKIDAQNLSSSWFSRNMALFGLVILLFLILHLYHIYLTNKFMNPAGLSLYEITTQVLSDQLYAVIYLVALIALGAHLKHGFQSAFQTFGCITPKSKHFINLVAVFFWLIVPILFATQPIYFAFIK